MSTQIFAPRRGSIRRALRTTTFLIVGMFVAAQAQAQGQGMMNATPEQRAAQRIEILSERLQLTQPQAEQLEPVLVKQFTEQVALFQKFQGGGDRQTMMSEMRALRTRFDEEIGAVLTDAQKATYRTLVEDERARRMERVRGGGGSGQ